MALHQCLNKYQAGNSLERNSKSDTVVNKFGTEVKRSMIAVSHILWKSETGFRI